MPLPIPNLDDRRWMDLVEDGRSLIPLYGPEWTDHNYHDPGVTLMELLAWVAEMDLYELNRVPDRHKRKFLALVGMAPDPPRPARTVISVQPGAKAVQPLVVPAGIHFSGVNAFGVTTLFRTLTQLTAGMSGLQAIQIKNSGGFHDSTEAWRRGLAFGILGDVPETGSEVYFGFDSALAKGIETSLYLGWASAYSSGAERERLIEERTANQQDCAPTTPSCHCGGGCSGHATGTGAGNHASHASDGKIPRHQGVRLEWEYIAQVHGSETWRRLDPELGEIDDDTRSFTLDGRVLVKPPTATIKTQVGQVADSLYYVRARLAAGSYDAPPVLRVLAVNAVVAEQSVPLAQLHWTIAAGVVATGLEPKSGEEASFHLKFNAAGQISALEFAAAEGNPQFFVLQYVPAQAHATGVLGVEADWLPAGSGLPVQQGELSQVPVDEPGFELWTLGGDGGVWYRWWQRADFDASSRSDRHFVMDATTGMITFGDGNQGLILRNDERPFAIYRSTRVEGGNLAAGPMTLPDSLHNRAVSQDFDKLLTGTGRADCIVDATGGAAAETLAHAIGRAVEGREAVARAVTASDCESLALRTPGTQIARAKAWPNLHASFPCLSAPGMITVVIVPAMPVPQPLPSPGTLQLVAAYLNRRRVVGTRVLVVGPSYREVAVRCQVAAFQGASKTVVQQRVTDALNRFLSPLQGGPDGGGWPFGRDVYRSEMLKVVDQVPGVDHVLQLSLLVDGCECDPQCGNVCLAPAELVDAGQHEITVI